MADFCLDCTKRLGLPEPNIRADPGATIWDVCEGCGPGWFDEHGKRVLDEETTMITYSASGRLPENDKIT
jgi:hypothetical protein